MYHVVSEQVGKEKAWKEAKIEDVHKWSAATKGFKDDGNGAWKGVEGGRWEFMEAEGQKGVMLINAQRTRNKRFSGEWGMVSGNGNGNGYANGHANGSGRVNGGSSYSVRVSVNGN